MDCSPPGSSVHGILPRVAMPFFRGSSQPRDRIHVSCITSRLFTTEPNERTDWLKDIGSSSQMIKNFEDKVSGCTTQCMQQMQMSSTIQNGQVHVMWPSDLIQNFEILKWCWVILWFLKKTIFSYKYYLHDFNIINSQYSMKAMAKNDQFNGWSKCWTLFSLKIFLISQL